MCVCVSTCVCLRVCVCARASLMISTNKTFSPHFSPACGGKIKEMFVAFDCIEFTHMWMARFRALTLIGDACRIQQQTHDAMKAYRESTKACFGVIRSLKTRLSEFDEAAEARLSVGNQPESTTPRGRFFICEFILMKVVVSCSTCKHQSFFFFKYILCSLEDTFMLKAKLDATQRQVELMARERYQATTRTATSSFLGMTHSLFLCAHHSLHLPHKRVLQEATRAAHRDDQCRNARDARVSSAAQSRGSDVRPQPHRHHAQPRQACG